MRHWRVSNRTALPFVCFYFVLWLLGAATAVRAQEFTTLLQYTNVWKYDQAGLELGSAWRTNDYDDLAWPQGRGLLGFESLTAPYQVTAPVLTQLTVSQTVTTFYFRATFVYTGETAGLRLFATNLLDDGAVIYLNGLRAAQVRLTAQNPFATTLANGGPAVEGQFDVVELVMAEPLRVGINYLAVEVHQASPASNDIMWGMKLAAVRDLPLSISRQPESIAVFVGGTAQFSVEVSGGPKFYRWYRDGALFPGATNATLSIPNAQTNIAGSYYVTASNLLNVATSSVATLTVLPDTAGPRPVQAWVPATSLTNTIVVFFDEVLLSDSRNRNTNNYLLLVAGTADQFVAVSNVQVSGTAVILRVGGANWEIGGDYYLILNNVIDRYTNVIAPNTRIAVGWPKSGMALFSSAEWSFHTSAQSDPSVYDEDWTAAHYVEDAWWRRGTGPFCGVPTSELTCFGGCNIQIGLQSEPTLFRTSFVWPEDWPATAQFRPRIAFDDGFVLYLNGREIVRSNVPPGVTRMTRATRASANTTNLCATNLSVTVSNLVAGTNWLAAATVDAIGDGTTIFALELEVTANVAPVLPQEPTPSLVSTLLGDGRLRLAWDGFGYTLESVTNLTDNFTSAPLGPWQQVPGLSNPYTNDISDPSRFFRLRR